MSTLEKEKLFSEEEYLDREEKAEFKSEYFAGRIYALAGASLEHNLIGSNVNGELRLQLKGKSCFSAASDLRVQVEATGLDTYPDVVVVCGEPRLRRNTLLNPTVIVEVLSRSTEAYDRGFKFENYRQIESLTDYVLIAQDRMQVDHYVRQPDNRWTLSSCNLPEEFLQLESIDCVLPLFEIYDRVTFPVFELHAQTEMQEENG